MRPRLVTALGVSVFTAAIYIATGPGRIDIIDGQYRFEVAKNIVDDWSIQLRDPFLGDAINGLLGTYSPYGLSGSLTGVPLVAIANWIGAPSQDRQQFFFSFTSGILGAATAGVLFLFLLDLTVPPRRALWWTLIACFTTLAWPVATSTFDQTQHGFFVLLACMLAFLSAQRKSRWLAAAAGGSLAFLVNYQITYIILLPTVAIAALAAPGATMDDRKLGFERAILVGFVGALGVLVWVSLNNFRFGTLLAGVQMNPRHPPALGNPFIGGPALLVSPGKSLLLYSPPTLVALIGLVTLFRRERRLGQAIVATCLLYFAMIASLTFYGGDWCWGPRYFAAVLPLMALGFPFVELRTGVARAAVRLVLGAGLAVQIMAVSIDHHRFFYGRSLPTFFWYTRPGYYFTHSALFDRPGEILASMKGVPAEATDFRPGPYSGMLTYAVFGGWGYPELPAAEWMRRYQVFWLPRPWPLWMRAVPHDQLVGLPWALATLGLMAGAGLAGMSAVRFAKSEGAS